LRYMVVDVGGGLRGFGVLLWRDAGVAVVPGRPVMKMTLAVYHICGRVHQLLVGELTAE